MRAGLAVAICVVVLAGCGDEELESEAAEGTEVTIVLDADGPGGEAAVEAEVVCPGANAPPTVCEAIEDLPADATAPIPPETPCTEIYGGPDAVTLEGTLSGEPVDTRLTRANGCEIERFDRFAAVLSVLFPDYEPGAAAAPGA